MQQSHPLQPGELVRLVGIEEVGEIVKVWGQSAIVDFEYMSVTVSLKEVERIPAALQAIVGSKASSKGSVRLLNINQADFANFKTEIDLHGMYVQEALQTLDQWLNKANLLGHQHLRVIHGIGQGILRKEIRAYLRSHALVKKVIEQHPFQGAGGVTGVELY
jgi:DNA mismatch repair protein MutS2